MEVTQTSEELRSTLLAYSRDCCELKFGAFVLKQSITKSLALEAQEEMHKDKLLNYTMTQICLILLLMQHTILWFDLLKTITSKLQ